MLSSYTLKSFEIRMRRIRNSRSNDGRDTVISLKVKDLHLCPSCLVLFCREEHNQALTQDLSEMCATYPILRDLNFSTFIARGDSLKTLKDFDEHGEMPFGIPSNALHGLYWIFFTRAYFRESIEVRRAVILHELGHFYIDHVKLLSDLRRKYKEQEEGMFQLFIQEIKQNRKWPKEKEKQLRDLYRYFVFDVLKTPGEIFANLWVKENFPDAFGPLMRLQLRNCKEISERTASTPAKVAKLRLLWTILRLEGFMILGNGVSEDLKSQFEALICLCWNKMLKQFPNEVGDLKKTTHDLLDTFSSPKNANEKLYRVYQEYLKYNSLKPCDFLV